MYFQTVLDRFWWYFDLNFTFSEDYTKYHFRSQESMVSAALPPSQVYMPHVKMPHLSAPPYYRYIRARSVYIGTSVTRFVYNVQRPNAIFLLRNLVLAMVCVKKNFPLVYSSQSVVQFVETHTHTRHGHEVTAWRSPSRLQTRSTRGHI